MSYARAQNEMEERAREEFERNDPCVAEWLFGLSAEDYAPIVTLAYRASRNPELKGSFSLALSNMVDDFVAWRIDEDEIAKLAREYEEHYDDERV